MPKPTKTETRIRTETHYRPECRSDDLPWTPLHAPSRMRSCRTVAWADETEGYTAPTREEAAFAIAKASELHSLSNPVYRIVEVQEVVEETVEVPRNLEPVLVSYSGSYSLQLHEDGKKVDCGNIAFLRWEDDGRLSIRVDSGQNRELLAGRK